MLVALALGTLVVWLFGVNFLYVHMSSQMVSALLRILQALPNLDHVLSSGPQILLLCVFHILMHFKAIWLVVALIFLHTGINLFSLLYVSRSKCVKWRAGRGSSWFLLVCAVWQVYHELLYLKSPSMIETQALAPNQTSLVNMSHSCMKANVSKQYDGLPQIGLDVSGCNTSFPSNSTLERDVDMDGISTGPQQYVLPPGIVHMWFVSLMAVAVRINWSLVGEKYNEWQDTHASFQLSTFDKTKLADSGLPPESTPGVAP